MLESYQWKKIFICWRRWFRLSWTSETENFKKFL